MKIEKLDPVINTGEIKTTNDYIVVEHGRIITKKDNPMYINGQKWNILKDYKRNYSLRNNKYKYIYELINDQRNIFVGLNFWQNQKFLFIQKNHWLQKEENIRYLINIAFLITGIIIAGDFHYPCVIAMREGAEPIGKVGPNMRQERYEWFKKHNSFESDICRKNCLDVCVAYSNKVRELRKDL